MDRNRLLSHGTLAAAAAAVALLAGAARAAGEGDGDEAVHLGVASCASSTCHGRVTPDEDSPLALNEYFVWSKYDHHAGAYKTLKGDWSRRIAANMGLADAATAEECLACHADDVPEERRGERFHLSDGIGCEACHGGAGDWIDSHYGPDASHAANLEAGMNPTEEPVFQARLCQSCHVGDDNRFVTHEMMAAGHPRLRFELDTWLANMPPHHVEDADYERRKGTTAPADRWATGVAVAAGGYLDILARHLDADALVPELSLFDCHACHRPMDTDVRRLAEDRRMMPAGTLRPQDQTLRMLGVVTAVRDEALSDTIERGNRALHGAAAGSPADFRTRLRALREPVARARETVTSAPLSADERAALQNALLRTAADARFRDYADAEQLYLALQALAAQDNDARAARYDTLFRLLESERRFDPRRVAAEARRLLQER
ncbi:hypothetical protein PC39_07569 [Salinisphaera sp. PC39]|uniref:multiheme c-type cytochrome n=1 Tax=Salinisphaera sp. PC39 TaxID=1304156 RepID=UPI0033400B65